MSAALVLGLVGGLLVVAFLANRVFGLTRIPDVLVLMMLGVLLGPVLGLVQPGTLAQTTNLLGTLAIILVLFEGGLELNLRDTLKHFPGSFLLATLAYIFSMVLVAVTVTNRLGLSWTDGLLVGAVLGCTSSTVVLPVLQQLQAEEPVRVTLMLEAAWGDVLAGAHGGAASGHAQPGRGGRARAGARLVEPGRDRAAVRRPWGRSVVAPVARALRAAFLAGAHFLCCSRPLCRDGSAWRQRVDRGAGLWPDPLQLSRR